MRSTKALVSLAVVASSPPVVSAFTTTTAPPTTFLARTASTQLSESSDTIVSPFDSSSDGDEAAVGTLPDMSDKGPLDLTWDNVELVLDDMRPYLIQDGGNVAITEIDGPVVRLELQGACGTCPSSTVRLG